MDKVINYENLEYNLIAPDNTDQLKGILPDKLIYNIKKRKDTHCMLAYDDADVYGVCVFMCTEIGEFIQYIEVSSNVHRQNIGGALIAKTVLWCAEHGAMAARVEISEEDAELKAFFEGVFL